MFIKRLIITSSEGVVRDLSFKKGLNLIIDHTPSKKIVTGNNVGKTTTLKLIDYCLGAKPNIIYSDKENSKEIYEEVKNFLEEKDVSISLYLSKTLESNSDEVVIERNFKGKTKKQNIRKINGFNFSSDKDFTNELKRIFFNVTSKERPTFRELISHNIRYTEERLNNTLKTLGSYGTDIEYQDLYLYLFNCPFDNSFERQKIVEKLKQERTFKEMLEKNKNKSKYEIALELIESEIDELNKKKNDLNLNKRLEQDLDELDQVKSEINSVSTLISTYNLKSSLIHESLDELQKDFFNTDIDQISNLYNEAKYFLPSLSKTFDELVNYHNSMVREKYDYIKKELPIIEERLSMYREKLSELMQEEARLTDVVMKKKSVDELKILISTLNEKYRKKGEYESIIKQLNESEQVIFNLEHQIEDFDKELFSSEYEQMLKNKLSNFNKIFSEISYEFYGERYAIDMQIKDKKGIKFYQFSSFNANLSTGKKQGEILCFDLAYIIFAEKNNITCMHFLLNDQKELMHNNQLIKVSKFLKNHNIQLIISILKDKIPDELVTDSNIVLRLSQDDKLFKIEKSKNDSSQGLSITEPN